MRWVVHGVGLEDPRRLAHKWDLWEDCVICRNMVAVAKAVPGQPFPTTVDVT